ncbi:mitochondrial biogenesis AIM24 [Nitzschia inconspicua]|uniref:Mitochondrial biogenesis AIM24 n=1 Tax=Nitzschia inconspicua TaxID=303405 RepID=A0A9K3KF84_9STRA|nr:mitochondrial biogenesis AIM24 [Nitzschia inconspicua]
MTKKENKRTTKSAQPLLQEVDLDPPVLKASGWAEVDVKEARDHKYAITGYEAQVVTVSLKPGEHCQGEPGSMMYLSPHVEMLASYSGCWDRCCGGESCFVLNFTNKSSGPGYAALVPSDPLAKVVPVELSSPEVGGCLIVQQGSYMASYGKVDVGMSCDFNFCRCCCGGMGLIRQKLEGTGTVFLASTGTIVQKVLQAGETCVIDTNCLLAYSKSCKFDLKRTGGVVGMFGGGEGIFNSTITGPGLVIMQSMNVKLLLESLAAEKMYRR